MSELPPKVPQLVWPLSDRGLSQRLVDIASMPFITGEHRFARTAFFSDLHTIEPLAPEGAALERELVQDNGDQQRLFRGPGWTAHVSLIDRRPEVQVFVTAATAELADEVMDGIRRSAPRPVHIETQERITLWTGGAGAGPSRHRRWVDTPEWSAIARNYAGDVRTPLSDLMTMAKPTQHGGRLLLWYGDPGTGKTTAIRALAHEWRQWADIHFVLDPEAFFGGPDYLMQVVAEADMWDPRWSVAATRWKVLVVEDADELIRSDARKEAGPSLGRLLNLTDGILGHGLRVLLLITTNEPMRGLHPAVVRPGRCLADVQFRRFTRPEAVEWLDGAAEPPPADATLAELYRARGDVGTVGTQRTVRSAGQYL